jgi:hypothetical protein
MKLRPQNQLVMPCFSWRAPSRLLLLYQKLLKTLQRFAMKETSKYVYYLENHGRSTYGVNLYSICHTTDWLKLLSVLS